MKKHRQKKNKQPTAKRDPKRQKHTQTARRENDHACVATSLGSLDPITPNVILIDHTGYSVTGSYSLPFPKPLMQKISDPSHHSEPFVNSTQVHKIYVQITVFPLKKDFADHFSSHPIHFLDSLFLATITIFAGLNIVIWAEK